MFSASGFFSWWLARGCQLVVEGGDDGDDFAGNFCTFSCRCGDEDPKQLHSSRV